LDPSIQPLEDGEMELDVAVTTVLVAVVSIELGMAELVTAELGTEGLLKLAELLPLGTAVKTDVVITEVEDAEREEFADEEADDGALVKVTKEVAEDVADEGGFSQP
jgi:hypothetical protein